MANLWVVVTGLAVLVERKGTPPRPYVVLLREVESDKVKVPNKSNGKFIPKHEPRLKLLPKGRVISIAGKDVKFLPAGSDSPELVDNNPFIRVGRELTEEMKVLRDHLDSHLPSDWARIALPGGGGARIWPIHVRKDFKLKTISHKSFPLSLVGAFDVEQGNSKEKRKERVANGLLYHRHIEGDIAPSVVPGVGKWEPIGKKTSVVLPDLGNQDKHYVAWVSNAGGDLNEKFDRDFYLLYDLLEEKQKFTKYVPVIRSREGGLRNPPGQCMIGYALADT